VLQQLSLTIEDERDEEPKSPSVKTKRSALSQSIEIYKSNQKKKEEEASKLMQEKKSHHTVIKTDYQLICKTEKRLPRA
jgi:predicted  nucleic acid-binding Zn-ribbon protein